MNKHIVFLGAGAVGGYVGGCVAQAGHDVTLIDPWPEHVEAIRLHGIRLGGTQGERVVRVNCLHLADAQALIKKPADIGFICVKLYDTPWAAALVAQYLGPGGFVVTMQNGLVEETVARIVGWGRTLGCVASNISVEAVGPGRIIRTQRPGGDAYTVFRVGELHGGVTARAEEIAALLRACDSARVTTNLWGERWSKLVANSMSTGVCALSGLSLKEISQYEPARRVQIRLAAEAIRVGEMLGFRLEPIRGLAPEKWLAAAAGDAKIAREVDEFMEEAARKRPQGGWSGTAQDIRKGRWPEIDHLNGLVAARAAELGLPAATHEAVTALVKRLACGELRPSPELLAALL